MATYVWDPASGTYVLSSDSLLTVSTNLADYSPGSTALITATNVTLGGAVQFSVLHSSGPGLDGVWGTLDDDMGTPLSGSTPWIVVDGGAGDLDGAINGSIITSWYVNDDAFGQSFLLTASDPAAAGIATTSFTDQLIVDFKQAANNNGEPGGTGDIDWINSIIQQSNSVYYEGMSVMQRVVLTGFTDSGNDGNITLNFSTQATKGGVHAYDWLTSWDQAIAEANDYGVPFDNTQVDPNQNSLHVGTEYNLTLAEASDGAIGPPNTLDDTVVELRSPGTDGFVYYIDVVVPDDPFISKDGSTQDRIDAYESLYGNRTIRVYSNQAITSATLTLSHSVANGGDTGDSDNNYQLLIDFAGTVTTNTQIMVELAGHLALGEGDAGWGTNLGSSAISGGPYHFNLRSIDGTSLGSQDNQIKGADIQLPPEPTFVLSGVKYEDAGGDGVKDPTDAPLSGWTFYLYKDNGITGTLDAADTLVASSGPTTGSGAYSFTDLATGNYIIVEGNQAGWSLTPSAGMTLVNPLGDGVADTLSQYGYAVSITDHDITTGLDFGNFENIDVSGYKFVDTDGNGSWDGSEPVKANWTVYLDNDNNFGNGVLATTTTDATGQYHFNDLGPGTYYVYEKSETGWTNTYNGATSFTAQSGVDQHGDLGQTEPLNFGNFENIDVSGYKFADLNGDGHWDLGAGELGIQGWTIYLDDDNNFANGVLATATTDADGHYVFSDLGPGSYYVYEQQQNGWTQTYNGTTSFTAQSGVDQHGDLGETEVLNFGNHLIEGPGVRTPGFWQNPTNGGTYWDGIIGNEAHAGDPCFPDGELLGYNDADGAGPGKALIANPYILLGDDNGDGSTAGDSGPYLKITLSDALKFINLSGAPKNDTSWNLARDAIATELNLLAGNPGGDPSDPNSPEHYLDQAILWLQNFDKNHDGTLTATELGNPAVKANSADWQKGIDTNHNVGDGYEILAGSVIHTALDSYNNDGSINGVFYAFDGDFCSDQQHQYQMMLQSAAA
ncbi:SdrD B-like domain-containing protein [Bradyrhizobium iriomotense]|uniref:SdrD B-like domain-containing protein n=1 Tax=Bradyrhizobium iriomotense TaxID=441950 RepID=UPI001B89ED32|nr:SdrD B-like domain-containing protein [Bradyrhizobium iriomotense]MBR1126690.1 hypothetical protein [Bradyrhizobium iriomotense]